MHFGKLNNKQKLKKQSTKIIEIEALIIVRILQICIRNCLPVILTKATNNKCDPKRHQLYSYKENIGACCVGEK